MRRAGNQNPRFMDDSSSSSASKLGLRSIYSGETTARIPSPTATHRSYEENRLLLDVAPIPTSMEMENQSSPGSLEVAWLLLCSNGTNCLMVGSMGKFLVSEEGIYSEDE